jgi:plasmid stabilization system protein ParE
MGTGLLDRIRMLETFPFAGKIVEEFDNPAIRELVLPPYRIVYRIDKRQKIIGIARFWHGSRGVLNTLQLNEPGSAFVVKNQT